MPKAKLSQIATTWIGEEDTSKGKKANKGENTKDAKEQLRRKQTLRKQTFTLQEDTIKRLWMHRVKTGKTISETLDELVVKHIPRYQWK